MSGTEMTTPKMRGRTYLKHAKQYMIGENNNHLFMKWLMEINTEVSNNHESAFLKVRGSGIVLNDVMMALGALVCAGFRIRAVNESNSNRTAYIVRW